MTVEYLVLGVILILMGGAQVWLRHGPGSEGAKRRAGGEAWGGDEAAQEAGYQEPDEEGPGLDSGGDEPPEIRTREVMSGGGGRMRSGRTWEAWTAMLGFIGIALGIVLVVLGALGK